MHFIREIILFICCLVSGALGIGLIILDMESLGIVVPELDKTWVGFIFLFFFLVFVVEVVFHLDD